MSPTQRGQTRFSVQTLASHLVQALENHTTVVQIVVIPGLLFFLDFTLRLCLRVDLIDAGADMALLAVATFITLLVEGIGYPRHTVAAAVGALLLFIVWIICLGIVSMAPIPLWFLDLRLVLSWFFGVLAFVFSMAVTDVITQAPPEANR